MSEVFTDRVIVREGEYWVVFRRREFGPFDYQWSSDLRGIAFTYQGMKFGEFCSDEEFFADLRPFGLPMTVCRIAALIAGNLALVVGSEKSPECREEQLRELLRKYGFARFQVTAG